ncbi:MAG: ComEA family DNA-binding protein [Polyangiales bacterium]
MSLRALAILLVVAATAFAALAAPVLAYADPPRAVAAAGPSPEGAVNLNTATAEELTRVPGIGPARADAIVRLRERVRAFRHVDDILRVRGIGRVTIRGMRPYLTLTGPTTLQNRPGRSRAAAE